MKSEDGIEPESASTQTDASIPPAAILMLRRAFRILRGCGISAGQLGALTSQALEDVKALPDIPFSGVSARETLACCDVVLKWRRDCRFLDSNGQPRALSTAGGSPAFAELVGAATRGDSPETLLQTMLELEVVRMADQSTVELATDSVVACPGQEGSLMASESVLEHVCGFLGSVEYNIFEKPSRARGKFERACYAWVPRKYVPVLQHLVSNRGQAFVDIVDEWLARRAVPPDVGEDSVLVGAGAYVFVRDRLSR